ncbi:MAG: DNA translocase FtsK [Deltaproteobacteria bacterium]|nr:DNA translocase FtsK [Deltaproteobacteria bacterium]
MRKEIKAIIFFLVAFILGVSLFTYHPDDKLFWNVTGHIGNVHNLFGTVGSHLAGGIFFLLGFSSFWLVVIFFIMAILSFRGRTLLPPIRSVIAILCLVVSFSGLIHIHLQLPETVTYRGGSVIGGGLVGLHVSVFMKGFLNYFGAYVFLLAIFIICFMICTHITLGQVFSRILLWFSGITRRVREFYTKKREKRRKGRVRKKALKTERLKRKRKVTIVEPRKEPTKKPEQESFAFMHVEGDFKLPPLDLLDEPPEEKWAEIQRESLEMNARRLEKKLGDFGVDGEVTEILPGPVITMYEFKPAPGIKISKVAGLSDDLTLALRAPSVRIVAPIPGKAAIGIEIANNKREHVYLQEVLSSQDYSDSKYNMTIALGKDITGAPVIADLTKMPHLLVAGATGTGKSVLLNAMINSILFKVSPDIVRFVMIDPKRIELSAYKDIPHLLHPVVTEPKEATRALRWAVEEMERRYMLLSDRGVRNIEAYNRKVMKEKKAADDDNPDVIGKSLPYIILIIDELADLMMLSSRGVEEAITRLAQMARAAGIHLIIATQRPSVDVLTGIIKANFPTRISFQVSSKVDSRTILDAMGAEQLLGEGDMLFMPPGVSRLTRIHGAYISEEEVKKVTDFLRGQMKPDYDTAILDEIAKDDELEEDEIEMDEKYDKAVDLVIQTGQASISMLQRRLRVGYNRAARMIEVMEKEGIVGPSDGVRAREVLGRRQ